MQLGFGRWYGVGRCVLRDKCQMLFYTLLIVKVYNYVELEIKLIFFDFFLLARIRSLYLTFLSPRNTNFLDLSFVFDMSSLFKFFFYFYNHLITLIPWDTFNIIYITSFIIENR